VVTEKGGKADTEVLVVGAGPVGLTLAILLQQQGVRVRVIDRMRRPSPLSRAIGVHARTLEVLEPHGVAARLVEAGVRLERVQMWSGGKAAVDVIRKC
jgi:2-polyprenyl-6-methoxyphenol hydroxylase-like FAD-dependent oxidoreductase